MLSRPGLTDRLNEHLLAFVDTIKPILKSYLPRTSYFYTRFSLSPIIRVVTVLCIVLVLPLHLFMRISSFLSRASSLVVNSIIYKLLLRSHYWLFAG